MKSHHVGQNIALHMTENGQLRIWVLSISSPLRGSCPVWKKKWVLLNSTPIYANNTGLTAVVFSLYIMFYLLYDCSLM
jgi:hypothetical protein